MVMTYFIVLQPFFPPVIWLIPELQATAETIFLPFI